MGEAKRRAEASDIRFAGGIGAFAGDAAMAARSEALVRELMPQLEALAERDGWATVLNALHTVVVNVGAHRQGLHQVEAAHRAVLVNLPKLAALMRAGTLPGGRA